MVVRGVVGGDWRCGLGEGAECQYEITGRLSAGMHANLRTEPSVEMRIYYKLIKLLHSLSTLLSLSFSLFYFLITSV